MKNSMGTFSLFHDVSVEIVVTVKRRWAITSEFNIRLAGLFKMKQQEEQTWMIQWEAVKFITTCNANPVIHYIIFVKGFIAIFMMGYHSTIHQTVRKISFSPKKSAALLMYWARKVIFQQRIQWYNSTLASTNFLRKIAIFHISSKWNYSIF